MKVICLTSHAIAISPRAVVSFVKNQILSDEIKTREGHELSETNLNRLIELKWAKIYNDGDEVPVEIPEVTPVTGETTFDFESITEKDALVEHALQFYGVTLEKKGKIEVMIASLKNAVINNLQVA